MGLSHSEIVRDESAPFARTDHDVLAQEHGQRWGYRCWQEWMQADSWADLKEHHTRL
jgi:3-phenylpropionate/trans-cinnamate dioxygenase alpha subunit